ncbi:MAG: hypothetical protein PUP93_26850 [Rhizonema sp. NSF051]|nr:hypothetical protein [Rhizonema sp. NSF051]
MQVVVSSWNMSGYGNKTPGMNEKYREIEALCRKFHLPNPTFDDQVHSHGVTYKIYASERILNHMKPIWYSDFDED